MNKPIAVFSNLDMLEKQNGGDICPRRTVAIPSTPARFWTWIP